MKLFFLITLMQNKLDSVKKPIVIEFHFELPANLCQPSDPGGQINWHWLAGGSKGNTIT